MEGLTTKVDNLFTETGVKDKFLTAFIDRLRSVHDVRSDGSPRSREEVLADRIELFKQLPEFPFNPALRIPGQCSDTASQEREAVLNSSFADFDPHSDTPVEALHVLLLGFAKYLWRDAVSRQTSERKELLKSRLTSLDVRGLGLPSLRGHTLVQYARSLTGGDFRTIVQVAPLVLYDLVPAGLLDIWNALGRMAALVYQPSIPDIDEYCVRVFSGGVCGC